MTLKKFNSAIADFENQIKSHLEDVYKEQGLEVKKLENIVTVKTVTTGMITDSNEYKYEFTIKPNSTELKPI